MAEKTAPNGTTADRTEFLDIRALVDNMRILYILCACFYASHF